MLKKIRKRASDLLKEIASRIPGSPNHDDDVSPRDWLHERVVGVLLSPSERDDLQEHLRRVISGVKAEIKSDPGGPIGNLFVRAVMADLITLYTEVTRKPPARRANKTGPMYDFVQSFFECLAPRLRRPSLSVIDEAIRPIVAEQRRERLSPRR